jgi:hypothetical protein
VIEYLGTENQVLKEAHGKRRIRLNDDQRRRLAAKGKVLGRKLPAFSLAAVERLHSPPGARVDRRQAVDAIRRPIAIAIRVG